ncbi:MAG: peroxiredoxin family protein [Chloroflexota bacterium]
MGENIAAVVEGSAAPDFNLESNQGGSIHLSDYQGHKHVILYFMREFSCLQCQRHAIQLGRLYEQLKAQNVEVLVIGGGERKDAERLSKLLNLTYPVLADPDRSVYARYALDKVLIAIQRSGTFLIDQQGIVRYIHQATNPNASLNKSELMQAIEGLGNPQL